MHPVITKPTLLELNNEHNGYKVENVVQFIGISITGGSKVERAMLRLRNEQLLKEIGRSNSQEQALKETCLWQLSEIQSGNERLTEQKQLSDEWKGRGQRAEILLAALAAIFLVHLLLPRTGLMLATGWLGIGFWVYIPSLLRDLRFAAVLHSIPEKWRRYLIV
jgi:hypothetical protein